MAGAVDLAKMVPGFEFLQSLMKNAGAAIPGVPGMSQWIAPTLDPAELDKRIQELKTVQFWLEQNARLLATTIQALEVQRMTLSTLQTMNLPMADLRDALKIRLPETVVAKPAPEPEPEPEPAPAPAPAAEPAAAASAAPAVDPMQWWTALTQQFTQIAAQAVKDSAAAAAKRPAAPAAKAAPQAAKKAAAKAAVKAAPRAAAPRPRRG
jgi:hypothetical protein